MDSDVTPDESTGKESVWMIYAGMVESGDPGSSRSVDEIVYGSDDLTAFTIR